MVNADKHKALKILNEITKPSRILKQESNKKRFYNKTKYKVNAECNFNKEGFGRLEKQYNNI